MEKSKGSLVALIAAAVCLCAALMCAVLPAQRAYAAGTASNDQDIMIGVWTYGTDWNEDWTDYITASYDGVTNLRIADAFVDRGDHQYADNGSWCMTCPSIMYKDGYFWMLSAGNSVDDNGRASFCISYSKDLVNWTKPWGFTADIKAGDTPYTNGSGDFNIVAPEWFLDDNGDVYIAVSLGYYGAFNGEPETDRMQPYLVKVSNLTAEDPYWHTTYNQWFPLINSNISFGEAYRLNSVCNIEGYPSNLIDGCLYKENGKYYFIDKNQGLWNDIFVSNSLGADGWTKLVDNSISVGHEAPSLVKLNGTYYCYVDGIATAAQWGYCEGAGTRVYTSNTLARSSWDYVHPTFISAMGDNYGQSISSRHGSVFVLEAGTEGWQVAHDLLE